MTIHDIHNKAGTSIPQAKKTNFYIQYIFEGYFTINNLTNKYLRDKIRDFFYKPSGTRVEIRVGTLSLEVKKKFRRKKIKRYQ